MEQGWSVHSVHKCASLPKALGNVIIKACLYRYSSYGRLGQPAMTLLHSLGDEAAGPRGVSRASFAAGALQGVVDIMHVHESMQLIIHGVELLDIGSTGHNEV
jgi:hypothetical protein